MIRHWLGQEPSEDIEEFASQAAQAEWLEHRHFEFTSKLMGARK